MMVVMMMLMMMQLLISVTSCNVNAADSDQTTPLVMAALQGNAVICETLVRERIRLSVSVTSHSYPRALSQHRS